MIGTGRSKLLEHPLFEIFIQLKWLKLWRIYTGIFLFLLLHLLAITLFSLARYSRRIVMASNVKMARYRWLFMASKVHMARYIWLVMASMVHMARYIRPGIYCQVHIYK